MILTRILTFLTLLISVFSQQVAPFNCTVCVQAFKNEIGLNNQNPVQFALNAPSVCVKSTADTAQQVSCITTFTQNAQTLFKNSLNKQAVPEAVCGGVGAVGAPCQAPTVAPTKAPTVAPTKAPTKPPRFNVFRPRFFGFF